MNSSEKLWLASAWYVETLGAISVKGSDSNVVVDFLNRLTTQDFKNMNDGEMRFGAIVGSMAKIQNLFLAQNQSGDIWLWTEIANLQLLNDNLEKMHFAEDLEIKIEKDEHRFPALTIQERVSKGLFKFGMDITEKNLILEAPTNSFIHRDKGCYPGQEVVERIFTYSTPGKKLVGLKLDFSVPDLLKKLWATAGDITLDRKKIGSVTSLGEKEALVMIQKPHFLNGTKTDQGVIFNLKDDFTFEKSTRET